MPSLCHQQSGTVFRAISCIPVELDFSHLGVKGIDTLFTPLHNKRSLLLPTPADHGDRALGSLQATALNTRLPTRPLFCRGTFCGSVSHCDPQKVCRAL